MSCLQMHVFLHHINYSSCIHWWTAMFFSASECLNIYTQIRSKNYKIKIWKMLLCGELMLTPSNWYSGTSSAHPEISPTLSRDHFLLGTWQSNIGAQDRGQFSLTQTWSPHLRPTQLKAKSLPSNNKKLHQESAQKFMHFSRLPSQNWQWEKSQTWQLQDGWLGMAE